MSELDAIRKKARGSMEMKALGQTSDKKKEEDDVVDSLLHKAIDTDQSIVGEADLLQSSSPSSPTPVGSDPDPRVDLEARKMEAKALNLGEIIGKARHQLRELRENQTRKSKA